MSSSRKTPAIVRRAMDMARAAIERDGELMPLLIFLNDKKPLPWQ